jgi:hypothetical protein
MGMRVRCTNTFDVRFPREMNNPVARILSVETPPSWTGLNEAVVLQRVGQLFVSGFNQEGLVVENYYR